MKSKRKIEAMAYFMGVSYQWARKQLKDYGRTDMFEDDNCPTCNDTETVTDLQSEALGGNCYCTTWLIPNVLGDKP
jgi:hypothetical protein